MPETTHHAAVQAAPEALPSSCRAWVRSSPRRETPCYLRPLSEEERLPAKVLDLSTAGIGLRLEKSVDQLGRFVLVELVSASGVFSRLLLTRVAHLADAPGGGCVLGGEFISALPEAELRFLLS